MPSLPEDADPRVQRYFDYYNRRLEGQPVEEIAQALGFPLPDFLYCVLKEDGFPVCEVCGETPAAANHCFGASVPLRWVQMEEDFAGFAQREMAALGEAGLSGTPRLRRQARTRSGRPVQLADGRTAYVSLSGWGADVYEAPRVEVGPPRSDEAILVALVVAVTNAANLADPRRIRIMCHLRDGRLREGKKSFEELEEELRTDPVLKDATFGDVVEVMRAPNILDFLEALARYYPRVPNLDELPANERAAILQRLYERIKAVLDATGKLQESLELRVPKRLPTNKVRDVERYIFAAELSGALKLNSVEVGEFMRIPLDREYYEKKHQNKTASDMIGKGMELLLQIFGDHDTRETHFEQIRPALKALYARCSPKSSESWVREMAKGLFENGLIRVLVARRELIGRDDPIGVEDLMDLSLLLDERELDPTHGTQP